MVLTLLVSRQGLEEHALSVHCSNIAVGCSVSTTHAEYSPPSGLDSGTPCWFQSLKCVTSHMPVVLPAVICTGCCSVVLHIVIIKPRAPALLHQTFKRRKNDEPIRCHLPENPSTAPEPMCHPWRSKVRRQRLEQQ